MLQFTKDNTITLTIKDAQGIAVPDNTKVTGFISIEKATAAYWYYRVEWFMGDFTDYPPSGGFIKFDQLPSDFKVDLKDSEGVDIYTIPASNKSNYARVIDEASYPLLHYIMNTYSELNGKLVIGGLG